MRTPLNEQWFGWCKDTRQCVTTQTWQTNAAKLVRCSPKSKRHVYICISNLHVSLSLSFPVHLEVCWIRMKHTSQSLKYRMTKLSSNWGFSNIAPGHRLTMHQSSVSVTKNQTNASVPSIVLILATVHLMAKFKKSTVQVQVAGVPTGRLI